MILEPAIKKTKSKGLRLSYCISETNKRIKFINLYRYKLTILIIYTLLYIPYY